MKRRNRSVLAQLANMGTVIHNLAESLRRSQNADGGWGYFPGKASRLEPTAFAALALAGTAESAAAAAVLHQWPSTDGLLLERAGGEPNYGFHGVALLAMRACRIEHVSGTVSLIGGLQRVKGVRLAPSPTGSQDNTLQAWSCLLYTSPSPRDS